MPLHPQEANPTHMDRDEQAETLSALKRFARMRANVERCELCGAGIGAKHPHLLDRRSRQIACACDACAILFCDRQDGNYLRIPRRVRQLEDFAFSDLEWEVMMLPINLAFFVRNSEGRMMAMYPSPGGAIASEIRLFSWEEKLAGHRHLRAMAAEVEALVVNRVGAEAMYFIAPIDECYRLTGLIRTNWRGLSGGTEVWAAIAGFFQDLKRKAGTAQETHYA